MIGQKFQVYLRTFSAGYSEQSEGTVEFFLVSHKPNETQDIFVSATASQDKGKILGVS